MKRSIYLSALIVAIAALSLGAAEKPKPGPARARGWSDPLPPQIPETKPSPTKDQPVPAPVDPSKKTPSKNEPAKTDPVDPAKKKTPSKNESVTPVPDSKVPAKKTGEDVSREGKITKEEQEVLEDYVKKHKEKGGKGKGKKRGQSSLPPGLQKKVERGKELPPGWQKKIAPGETMSQEVYEAAQPLPKEVTSKLPPAPHGTTNLVLEGKVIRVMDKTRQILDVLDLNK